MTQAALVTAPLIPINGVDVTTKLDQLAKADTEKLSCKTSIVDLMKLLGLDSTLTECKALATERGCTAEKLGDSLPMNI